MKMIQELTIKIISYMRLHEDNQPPLFWELAARGLDIVDEDEDGDNDGVDEEDGEVAEDAALEGLPPLETPGVEAVDGPAPEALAALFLAEAPPRPADLGVAFLAADPAVAAVLFLGPTDLVGVRDLDLGVALAFFAVDAFRPGFFPVAGVRGVPGADRPPLRAGVDLGPGVLAIVFFGISTSSKRACNSRHETLFFRPPGMVLELGTGLWDQATGLTRQTLTGKGDKTN